MHVKSVAHIEKAQHRAPVNVCSVRSSLPAGKREVALSGSECGDTPFGGIINVKNGTEKKRAALCLTDHALGLSTHVPSTATKNFRKIQKKNVKLKAVLPLFTTAFN